ncbi:hypothetical protein Bca101_084251 [Brassica carinata]
MAQRTEKEETEFKVLESLTTTTATTATLCSNNCGVTANPATNNMCQKCFNASIAAAAGVDSPSMLKRASRSVNLRSTPATKVVIRHREIDPVKRDQQTVNRCSGCRKKVGLTGFRCRCGDLFCSEHRYSDRHDCSYDYKTAGREAIARENPVVKAAKMVHFAATKDSLSRHFNKFGEVLKAVIVTDPAKEQPSG